MSDIKIYFDGGCKPNPGKMEICVIIDNNGVLEPHVNLEIGDGTNNLAEWAALVWAASIAAERGYTSVTFYGDSNNIVNQANNIWKIKEKNFLPFKTQFVNLNNSVQGTVMYVPRESNKAGVYLEHGLLC